VTCFQMFTSRGERVTLQMLLQVVEKAESMEDADRAAILARGSPDAEMTREKVLAAMQQLKDMSPEELTAFGIVSSGSESTHSDWAESIHSEWTSAQQQCEYNAALRLKEEGNKLHGKKQYAAAADSYKRAADKMERHTLGDLQQRSKELQTSCALNLGSCYMQLGRWQECEEQCSAVLHGDAANCKALYRRGRALAALGKHVEAIADFKAALRASPASDWPLIHLVLEQAKRKEKLNAHTSDGIRAALHDPDVLAEIPSVFEKSPDSAVHNGANVMAEMQLQAVLKKNSPWVSPGYEVGDSRLRRHSYPVNYCFFSVDFTTLHEALIRVASFFVLIVPFFLCPHPSFLPLLYF
jgi:tetratricopeptide (TPR) repeat protein